ncbi:MAG: two-component sensor histidine kinase [Hyphomicrobiales bacterium]|nr:two-component sensor histidine kinase [Hyphomicrobiales bacterium]
MTALGKLFRTTAFKLSIVYLVLFSIGAGVVMTWVGWNVRRLVDEQIGATVEAEINGLSEQYAQGGIRRLVDVVERRVRQPGASLYLVTNFQGQSIAGNIIALPPEVLRQPGVRETSYERMGEANVDRRALARIFVLPGGFRLLVGRDLEDRETLRRVMGGALLTSLFWLIVIGTLGGLFVARRVLNRVEGINDSARAIMQGDLAQRLPLAGANDELDRLAINLNAMLERIQELMTGVREVSDNIAHDLKTPLTRLRNRAEEALRTSGSTEDYRAALEKMIEESDQLIRIFNALLMIARLEAGAERGNLIVFDMAEAARDVADLYEPVAEDEGVDLTLEADEGCNVRGSRELIGQALANLIDNALKYGAPDMPGARSQVRIEVRRVGSGVEMSVADHGPGIAAEDRERVLGRFVRLEGARTRPGSGLGLSLAAAVARLHNGAIRIEDNQPGLRVVIAMPAAAGEAGAGPSK